MRPAGSDSLTWRQFGLGRCATPVRGVTAQLVRRPICAGSEATFNRELGQSR